MCSVFFFGQLASNTHCPGKRKLECIENRLNKSCSQNSTLDERLQIVRAFNQRLLQLPELHQNQKCSCVALLEKLSWESTDTWFEETHLADVWIGGMKDCDIALENVDDLDLWKHSELPLRTIMKHAFFGERDLEESQKSHAQKYQKLQRQLQDTRSGRSKACSRKMARTDTVIKKFQEKNDPAVKSKKLARKNQINRSRKNHQKPRVIRDEESLPQAWTEHMSCVYVVLSGFVWSMYAYVYLTHALLGGTRGSESADYIPKTGSGELRE